MPSVSDLIIMVYAFMAENMRCMNIHVAMKEIIKLVIYNNTVFVPHHTWFGRQGQPLGGGLPK